jgi:hypothetical protein
MGHLVGDLNQFLLRPEQFAERGLGLVEQRAAGEEVLVLFEKQGLGARVQANVAVIGRVLPGQDAHERRLAGPIRANEPNALAVVQLKREVVEQRPAVKGPRQVGTAQQ